MPSSPVYQALPLDNNNVTSIIQVQKTTKSYVATIMLIICIISFVLQTELAQFVQKTSSYQKPYFILYIGHVCYIAMIPIQLVVEFIQLRWFSTSSTYQEKPSWSQQLQDTLCHCKKELTHSIIELEDRVQGSQQYVSFMIRQGILLAVLFTIPAYLWYISVNLISMSNLTVIFNTGCFFAYLFSIFMLGDAVILSKVIAVALSILGVVVMSVDQDNNNNNDTASLQSPPSSFIGFMVAALSAIAYGYYEVYYKKYATPTQPSVLFANMVTGFIGIITLILLWIPIPILHYTGYETFELPDKDTFLMILGIGSMSVVYNASMMCVIALVSPLFAAVGVMLTIPVVAVTDVLVTGVMVSFSTILGSIFILIGFFILNRQISIEEKIQYNNSIQIDNIEEENR
ncbi:hypothetical protein BJ944DRAFT_204354 [Cunninghamella echinulata]|nr:hypothetical protein BJ944DRAFT_204354 [Cunninghamella echinulata]